MPTCLGKSCSFSLPCVSCVRICQFLSVLLSLLVMMIRCGIYCISSCSFITFRFTFQCRNTAITVQNQIRIHKTRPKHLTFHATYFPFLNQGSVYEILCSILTSKACVFFPNSAFKVYGSQADRHIEMTRKRISFTSDP